jgi:hypothetical protein
LTNATTPKISPTNIASNPRNLKRNTNNTRNPTIPNTTDNIASFEIFCIWPFVSASLIFSPTKKNNPQLPHYFTDCRSEFNRKFRHFLHQKSDSDATRLWANLLIVVFAAVYTIIKTVSKDRLSIKKQAGTTKANGNTRKRNRRNELFRPVELLFI